MGTFSSHHEAARTRSGPRIRFALACVGLALVGCNSERDASPPLEPDHRAKVDARLWGPFLGFQPGETVEGGPGLGGRTDRTDSHIGFQPLGTWSIKEPVHERATHASLERVGLAGPSWEDAVTWEFMRGVYWNDDPEGMLFFDGGPRTDRFSTGVTFLEAFMRSRSQSDAANGRGEGTDGPVFRPGHRLLARSHFGDLQFLHGMRCYRAEPAEETRRQMLDWAEFTYRIAVEEIGPTDRLGDSRIHLIRALFSDQPDRTVSDLFGVRPDRGILPERALGSLLHMLQDSYSESHVQRAQGDAGPGAIHRFEYYGAQDADCHAQADRKKESEAAIVAGEIVLRAWQQRAYWTDLRALLIEGPLALDARDDLPAVCAKPR